ncbi:uncharacterized protein [Littorina saxatilis]|uniref:uncharacterized protein n=1 Tax=Littorina saxatilis TaxID=31220 RepID=UPI0038B55504
MYETEALRQLNNPAHYTRLDVDPTPSIAKTSNDFVEQLQARALIDENCYRWALLDPETTRTSVFYHLPKVHKDRQNPPGRPIISGCGGPTEKMSKLVDHWLQPLVRELPSYVKDTTHFLQLVENWKTSYGPLPIDALIVTVDVVGLYTNIPHQDVGTSVADTLSTGQHLVPEAPPKNLLLKIIDHVLHNNVFQFDGQIFKQIFGTAMGTPMAPTIANIFMAMWKRYIDDITIWLHGKEELVKFIEWLNEQHPTIKFTYSYGRSNVPYLDVNLSITPDGLLTTDLHVKPTDAAMILPFHSCHPRHCPRSIPYSQCLRLRRICSDEETFRSRCTELKGKLEKRGYPTGLINAAVETVGARSRDSVLQYVNSNQPKADRVPFVIRHNPSNPPLGRWLKGFMPVLHTSARMKKAVPNPPIVGERNCYNIRNLLMPSGLPPSQNLTPVSSAGCHSCPGCVLCAGHLRDTTTFSSVVTGQSFHIRDCLSCTSTNVVYLIDCEKCHGKQYVGETGQTVRRRFYGHTYTIRKDVDTLVAKHFRSPEHSLSDMRVTVIEQVKVDNVDIRRQRERFWRYKLRTNYPEGLHVFD